MPYLTIIFYCYRKMADTRTVLTVEGDCPYTKTIQNNLLKAATNSNILICLRLIERSQWGFIVELHYDAHLGAYQTLNFLKGEGWKAEWQQPPTEKGTREANGAIPKRPKKPSDPDKKILSLQRELQEALREINLKERTSSPSPSSSSSPPPYGEVSQLLTRNHEKELYSYRYRSGTHDKAIWWTQLMQE